MKRLAITNVGLRFPWWVLAGTILLSGGFLLQFPKVTFDNDPENMLAEDEPVRLFHHEVKERFSLYDFVIVGVVNETHQDGIFNVDTLGRIDDLTKELISLHQTDEGRPAVIRPARGDRPEAVIVPELRPQSARKRILAKAFRHNPEDLFHQDGSSVLIHREIISPSVIDNIRQAELGQLKIEYLMEQPPTTREEALAIREDAMNNPLYKGTVVSEDGQAICLYLPVSEKVYSYNVANLVEQLTADWGEEDHVYITGLPVAEDTFGVEMLVQMATSAPLAGLMIFILLLLFFRRLSLVIAPMVVAIVSVICTMGLLIGLGFDVHIMSSMIAIFLMPIAVADSVHILSEFFDTYHRFGNKREAVRHVIGHLFMPMLYTSLTTMAGFASLAFTPIPPVRIFGLHVAFGVGLAWLLSMILVPAYIMVFVGDRTLAKLGAPTDGEHRSRLDPLLARLGGFSFGHAKLIIVATLLVVMGAGIGISRIEVNDNPVNWFTKAHRIRVADRVLNQHFGGTYTAYLTLAGTAADTRSPGEKIDIIRTEATKRFDDDALASIEAALGNSANQQDWFAELVKQAETMDEAAGAGWNKLADEINYLDPEGLTLATLRTSLTAEPTLQQALLTALGETHLTGEALQLAAIEACDARTARSVREFLFEMKANLDAPVFKRPAVLAYLETVQRHIDANPTVGKTSSAVDALKKANYELNFQADADAGRNQGFFAIPDTPSAVGQVFTQLEGMKKKDSLFHLVARDYGEVNLWIQLKSGDNKDMETVVQDVESYLADNPGPVELTHGWAGLTYINIIWQDKMVHGMLASLASSFVVVLVMMMVLFRSPLFGLLSMLPLTVTITFIYGLIGLVGKDYDMPVAVLSALTLGLSVDFAIHFLQRARELQRSEGSWDKAIPKLFKEPAAAISRNAIIISVGFTPLLLAPLVPYKTVGFFLATIMAVSWLATLLLLAALTTLLQKRLFQENGVSPTQ